MSFINQTLEPGERIVRRASVTPWVLFWPITLATIAVGFFVVAILLRNAMTAGDPPESHLIQPTDLMVIGEVASIAAVLTAISALISLAVTELAITNHRVIYRTGKFLARTVTIPHAGIEAVTVMQTRLGRIGSFGAILITRTGGVREKLPSIMYPIAEQKQLLAALPSPAAPEPDIQLNGPAPQRRATPPPIPPDHP